METPTKFYLMNGPLYADDLHPPFLEERHQLINLSLGGYYTITPQYKFQPVIGLELGTGVFSNAKDRFVNQNYSIQSEYYYADIFLSAPFQLKFKLLAQYTLGRFAFNVGLNYSWLRFKIQKLDHQWVPFGEDYGIGPIINVDRFRMQAEVGFRYSFCKK